MRLSQSHTHFSLVNEEASPMFPLGSLKLTSTEAACFFFSFSPVFHHSQRYCKMAAGWREVWFLYFWLFSSIYQILPPSPLPVPPIFREFCLFPPPPPYSFVVLAAQSFSGGLLLPPAHPIYS